MPPQPSELPDWDLYLALREQWTHEDKLVNHRLMWLILSQSLPFDFGALWLLALAGLIET